MQPHLFLAERQDGGGRVHQLQPDHHLHVEHLAADALHQHREEVGVGQVQGALRRGGGVWIQVTPQLDDVLASKFLKDKSRLFSFLCNLFINNR